MAVAYVAFSSITRVKGSVVERAKVRVDGVVRRVERHLGATRVQVSKPMSRYVPRMGPLKRSRTPSGPRCVREVKHPRPGTGGEKL